LAVVVVVVMRVVNLPLRVQRTQKNLARNNERPHGHYMVSVSVSVSKR